MKTITSCSLPDRSRTAAAAGLLAALALGLLTASTGRAQLFENLKSFGSRLKVGDPAIKAGSSLEGPKGIATADFDGDGHPDLAVANVDGTVTVFFGLSDGKFTPAQHLQTHGRELRGIIAVDLTGDGHPDIATAAPYDGQVYLFAYFGGRSFAPVTNLVAWPGARNLAAGDFDGDGLLDLAVAGTTNGLRHYHGLGGGAFEAKDDLLALVATNNHLDFPKPLYALVSFRPPGASRDELVVTHTDSDQIWLLANNVAGPAGALAVQGTIPNQKVYALGVGNITTTNGLPDLVAAGRDTGKIEIHRGQNSADRFLDSAVQEITVPGGPRAVQIVDLDRDGWNDLVVVLRNFDRVITYHNSNGVLVAASEMPVGKSPREMVVADFNGDQIPDLAVMNRDSEDVTVVTGYPGQAGFGGLDLVYPTDGGVSGLVVRDFNNDGRDDVLELHRDSGDFSVRLAGPGGILGDPKYYTVGNLPSAQATVDVDGDHIPDIVCANLGRPGIERGSISVRRGLGNGKFGPEQHYYLPSEVQAGRFFSIAAADFDNDGYIDLAVGFFDCRIVFFKGHGDGSFTKAGDFEHLFIYEARAMIVGDFDQDGDMDIAGVGYYGGLVVVENKGDIMTTANLSTKNYGIRCCGGETGAIVAKAIDVNGDGDLDIVVGSSKGTTVYLGGPGMDFILQSESLPGTDFPVTGMVVADFDGDGREDLAVSCRLLSCVTILTKGEDGQFTPSLTVDVPSGGQLATGDLDGDGKPDLVGSGDVLWTALSSRRAQRVPPAAPQALRQPLIQPVINELLAINNTRALAADGGRKSDWVEIFNDGTNTFTLGGWKLRLITSTGTSHATNDYLFPVTAFFPVGAHLVLVCSETIRTRYHTGFNLPGEGGTLVLLNPAGNEIDRVEYPAQQADVSYARFRDALSSWTFNNYPSPGAANDDNGPVDPIAQLEGFDPASLTADSPIRFYVSSRDDVGVISVTLNWKRLDIPDSVAHRVVLYDDGMHGDGGMQDGLFSGLLEPGLPSGAEIQFYLEVTDLSDKTIVLPDEPVFAQVGLASAVPQTLYTLALDAPVPPLEISEIVAANATGLTDERGLVSDWFEIRNCSTNPVPLDGVSIAPLFFETSQRYTFPTGSLLGPGEHRVVFSDNLPNLGPAHAPFGLSRAGDQLTLTGTTTHGGRTLIDSVAFGPQATNAAFARIGCGGPWRVQAPTPGHQNVPGHWLGFVSTLPGRFTLAFPTERDKSYLVEYTDSLFPPNWTALPLVPGDGIEKTITQLIKKQRYYRVSSE